jgi:mono/diheme cytochrome c family protein/plastocyanin
MVTRRIIAEWGARALLLVFVIGLPVTVLYARGFERGQRIEIHGKVPEFGGWLPNNLSATVGEPLHLYLTSDDVMHGFGIGQMDLQDVEIKPGEVVEFSITFDTPGTYTFYCTRWCGPNHWRMRGTIEVDGINETQPSLESPLYLTLGLDIDKPHTVEVALEDEPSAERGAALGVELPQGYLPRDRFESLTPYEVWSSLWNDALISELSDTEVWDLVAFIWQSNITQKNLQTGRELYVENCAACHGETGAGDGVFATMAINQEILDDSGFGRETVAPVDFTDSRLMLGASPALLQGKIIRGGMGTGMPYWGPIFTTEQTWALVDFLWTYQFQMEPLDPGN